MRTQFFSILPLQRRSNEPLEPAGHSRWNTVPAADAGYSTSSIVVAPHQHSPVASPHTPSAPRHLHAVRHRPHHRTLLLRGALVARTFAANLHPVAARHRHLASRAQRRTLRVELVLLLPRARNSCCSADTGTSPSSRPASPPSTTLSTG